MSNDFQHSPLDEWKLQMSRMRFRDPPAENPVVLLCGAKVWDGTTQVDHKKHLQRGSWVTTDILPGPEVDIAGDLQRLHEITDRRFDGVFCPSVLEHIERPWTAMLAMGQLLRPGGVLFVQTHQTFPLHGFPDDYFRFSTKALEMLCHDAGLVTLSSGYEFPCTITPDADQCWNELCKSYLNVCVTARRPG